MISKKIKVVTTTSSAEGWNIENYLGIVTYQLVIGANIFRDVFSSFRDFFGGSAKGYQKDLAEMERIAMQNLREKAAKRGANMILGVRLDFDEVLGGGKSMFMLSASGTAAYGQTLKKNTEVTEKEELPFDKIDWEIQREKLIRLYENKDYLSTEKELFDLFNYRIMEVEKMIDFIDRNPGYYKSNKSFFIDYFRMVDLQCINDFILGDKFKNLSHNNFKIFNEILEEIDWYNYEIILTLLEQNERDTNSFALFMINNNKSFYCFDDIQMLIKITEKLRSIYNSYPLIEKSKNMFGKEKEEWVCLYCNTKSDMDTILCQNPSCSRNRFGIKDNEIIPEELIEYLEGQIKIIQKLSSTAD